MKVINIALLGKWMWRFGREDSHLWRKVIVAKYGLEWGVWISKIPKGTHGCSLWKGILTGWDFFSHQVELVAGVGSRTRFWHDHWCGDVTLKNMFPVLYACSSSRNASLASCLTSSSVGEGRAWHITFIQDFNDWEVEEVLAFFNFIQSKIPSHVEPYEMRWKLHSSGVFDTKSFYQAIAGKHDIKFPWKVIWLVKAPRRVSFFMWSAAWGQILTCDNLMLRGFTMVGWCCMCRAAGETGSHLLVHCTFASDLWSSVFRSFGVLWVFPEHITTLLSGWYNYFGKHNSSVWNLVPLCLMWTIWRERNNRTFEDEKHSLPKLLELFYGLLFDWARVWGLTLEKSLAVFVVFLIFLSSFSVLLLPKCMLYALRGSFLFCFFLIKSRLFIKKTKIRREEEDQIS